MYKHYLLLTLALTVGLIVHAQDKASITNNDPYKGVDYVSGRLLVKLKPQYKDVLQVPTKRSEKTSRAFGKLKLKSEQMYHSKFIRKHSRRKANPSGIDVSLFHYVNYDASIPLNEAIKEMKLLGIFEYVEPDVVYQSAFEPSDERLADQYYLESIKAFEAWDITRGSENIVIGVVDAGSDFNHPDLQNKFYINTAEIPDNNIDDDENGYIDDVRGWDFAGADTLNPSQDNDPQIFVGGTVSHGTWVAGAAAADTDNGVGIAGVGFNSTLLTTKHAFDNQRDNDPRVFNPYGGVIFLTESKVDVMNLSWGGFFRSDIAGEIIRVAAEDEDIVVVAAAGNDNSIQPQYPASYPGVVNVAAIDRNDNRASFTNRGQTIDIAAPGVSILTTNFEGDYSSVQGTSFASPIVAGAAALLRDQFPNFTSRQIAQQLRVTADASIYNNSSNSFRTLGTGKLNILAALTERKPGIIYENISITNTRGSENIQPGDTIMVTGDFVNYLFESTPQLEAVLELGSPFITRINTSVKLGTMAEGQVINNALSPFMYEVSEFTGQDLNLTLRLDINDRDYYDFQFFDISINPSVVNVERNLVATSVPNNGRFGFRDFGNGEEGLGFIFQEIPVLFEMGLMMGTSASDISSTVRADTLLDGTRLIDDHFKSTSPLLSSSPGERSVFEVFGSLDNERAQTPTKVAIDYRSLVFSDDPDDQYVIMEYDVRNTGTDDIEGYYIGLYADWDIGSRDSSDWNADYRLGYIFNTNFSDTIFAGIQALTGEPNYYPINNNEEAPGSPFGVYDGFTDDEKFTSLSSGETVLTHANMPEADGNDMSHTIGSGPYNIPVGETIRVAFAIHAGDNLDDILNSAKAADQMYNKTFSITKPTVTFDPACIGEQVQVTASGASAFRWYSNQFGGDNFFEGDTYMTTPLINDTTLYVAAVQDGIESLRQPVQIAMRANPAVTIGGSTQICQGDTTLLIAKLADSYLWSNGATTRTIAVTESGSYSVTVTDNTLGCSNTSESIAVIVNALPVANFSIGLDSIDIRNNGPIQFTDASTNAVAWDWSFGNGRTSQEQSPSTEYNNIGDYTITLTATSETGCTSTITKTFRVTAIDVDNLLTGVSVFPNPNTGVFEFELQNESFGTVELQLTTINGQVIQNKTLIKNENKLKYGLDISELPSGLYLLKAIQDDKFTVKRVIKEE